MCEEELQRVLDIKRILTTLCLTLALLLGGVGCGGTSTDISDLVKRDGIYYE